MRAVGTRIVSCGSAGELDAARGLFAEYAAGLPHSPCFDRFGMEIAGLPGRYAPPSGRLVLALDGEAAVACGALREITSDVAAWRVRHGLPALDGRTCEMKRLFVRPARRGTGVGRALAEHLVAEARSAGYSRMWLDSEPGMLAAHALYRSLGFVTIPRYNDDPLPAMSYLGRELQRLCRRP